MFEFERQTGGKEKGEGERKANNVSTVSAINQTC